MPGELPEFDLDAFPASRWIVLSPHLDDGVLSCGNLLLALRDRGLPTTVATFFTECSSPLTLSARAFLRQCGARSAPELFARRRVEDAAAVAASGARALHAGLPDALFRRRPGRPTLLPELAHVYPTWRFHLARGVVSPADAGTVATVDRLVGDLLAQPADLPTVLVAPLGVGGHVDHVLVREAARRSGASVVSYADVPYWSREGLPSGVAPLLHPGGKGDLVARYASQLRALFPAGFPAAMPDQLRVEPQPSAR